ncbi:MAG: DUF2914 domain-containing protein [Pseudomonadota bacterium]
MEKKSSTKHAVFFFVVLYLIVGAFYSVQATAQNREDRSGQSASQGLTIVQAVMCEEIKENSPHNQAVVFSITVGRVHCFTSFDPVPEKTSIYHNWYSRDKLNTRIKLSLQPPRWATFSRIQLREADTGPWRVDITDEKGKILQVLRFNITD